MVVMDIQDHIHKTNNLLAQPAYQPIPRDPTNKIKGRLITLLRNIRKETGLDNSTYKNMYPAGHSVPKFYRLPKIHRPDTP